MKSGNASLEVDNISVEYEGRFILRNLSLTIKPGEFVSLLGQSGAGKSTLLRAIMKEVALASGSIRGPRRIAFAPQRAPLLPWLTVLENVELARPSAISVESFRQRAAGVLTQAGLGDHLHLKSHKLSGGMRSRASLIRAFLMFDVSSQVSHERPVILMDEPFIGLDVVKRDILHQLTQDLWAQTKPATIFVTHDLKEATKLANRVIVLSKEGTRFTLDRNVENESRPPTDSNTRAGILRDIYEALQ